MKRVGFNGVISVHVYEKSQDEIKEVCETCLDKSTKWTCARCDKFVCVYCVKSLYHPNYTRFCNKCYNEVEK